MLKIALFLSILTTTFALHPSQIQCFGVIGDSISAGFSMESHNIVKDFYEYRGQAFSVGGKEGFTTLPNIFRKFYNVSLDNSCASFATTFISHSIEQYHHHLLFQLDSHQKMGIIKGVNCNVAISGALSTQNIQMWNQLQEQWKTFNCQDKWKLLTIMIGANDICEYCVNGYNNTIDTYIFNMEQLFRNINEQSDKLFINVVSTFDVSLTEDYQHEDCKIFHWLINECPCILGRNKQTDAKYVVKKLYKEINEQLYKLVDKYNQKETIQYVIQPILENFQIYNQSYLSSLDCFHPSQFANEIMGISLWNNMFLPPEQKMKDMPYKLPIYIPNSEDILQ